jgi:RNA polymerase sigma-70 factor (ECF subfamily)
VENDLHEIILAAKRGDQTAFRQLVTAYKGIVYRHAFALLNDRMEAEDVAQEAFVKVYYSLSKLENEYAFASWLTRVVTNLCYDKNKKLNKKKIVLSDELSENMVAQRGPTPIDSSITKMSLNDAMEKIPSDQRIVIILRELQGYSYAEISDILHIPLGTVKSRINAARENLKKELQKG